MNDEEYRRRRSHLKSINPMTADCNPADEIAALRDRYVEERTEELMEGLYDDPIRLQEYTLEASYENTKLLSAIEVLGQSIRDPGTLGGQLTLEYFKGFFEEAVTQDATAQEAEI